MNGPELRLQDYLRHILKSIERIHRYIEDMEEIAFLQNEMAQDAVIRNIEIIGEASNNVMKCDPAFASSHDEIPWSTIYAMRNRVSHAYHKVDFELVWNLVQNELPALHHKITVLLSGV